MVETSNWLALVLVLRDELKDNVIFDTAGICGEVFDVIKQNYYTSLGYSGMCCIALL